MIRNTSAGRMNDRAKWISFTTHRILKRLRSEGFAAQR
jgi:hypothetical protein